MEEEWMGKASNSGKGNLVSIWVVGATRNAHVGAHLVNIDIILNKVDMLAGTCRIFRAVK